MQKLTISASLCLFCAQRPILRAQNCRILTFSLMSCMQSRWIFNGYNIHGLWCTWLTLRSGLCYRSSVCLSVCRLLVCDVGAPWSGVKVSGNIFAPLCTLGIYWPSCKISRRSSHGNPSAGGVKRKGVAK